MKQILQHFSKHYSYVNIQSIPVKVIDKFLSQKHIHDLSFERQMDYLYDYILSQGLCEVVE